ncbi:MAG: hypothetical protein LAT76_12080 [Schleiferiaceae bacterium]|nr:hypothetical protein [Schleiferiaceae bacterium]
MIKNQIFVFVFLLTSFTVCGQKMKHTIGLHLGVGQFSQSMLFPFKDHPSNTNLTGRMIFKTTPIFNSGMHYERQTNKWLLFQLRFSYSKVSFSYATENDMFEYVEHPFFDAFFSREFNSLSYQYQVLTGDFLVGLRFLKKKKFDAMVYVGPSFSHVVFNKFQHQPGEVFTTNPLIINQLFGPENLNTISFAFCFNPQINFKPTRDWSFSFGLQTFYFFQSFLNYNEIWERSVSVPFKENKSPRWGGLFQTGIQYHL